MLNNEKVLIIFACYHIQIIFNAFRTTLFGLSVKNVIPVGGT